MIEPNNFLLSVKRQCELLDISRASFYYEAEPISKVKQELLDVVDEAYTRHPYFGHRRMIAYLSQMERPITVGRKQMRSCYNFLGLEAIYPKPKISLANKAHKIYPYLLRDVEIERVNQVWSTDITYIRLKQGFIYLMAIIDWHSRYVLDWPSVKVEAFCGSLLFLF
jgi:putative transposase